MSGTSANVCIRIDTELKAQAEALFSELGMNLTTAFNIFLHQAVRENGIPFAIKLGRPNRETAAAIRDAASIVRDPEVAELADQVYRVRDGVLTAA